MFGNTESNVCAGEETTQSYNFTGLNAMEYYVR
jgi:hypothetical protein